MPPKAGNQSDRKKKQKAAPATDRAPSKVAKVATARLTDTPVPIVASDERRVAPHKQPSDLARPTSGKGSAHRESFAKQHLDHIPGESGPEVQPYLDSVAPSGAMNKSTVHQTESKVPHPMGKTRSGVGQRRGR